MPGPLWARVGYLPSDRKRSKNRRLVGAKRSCPAGYELGRHGSLTPLDPANRAGVPIELLSKWAQTETSELSNLSEGQGRAIERGELDRINSKRNRQRHHDDWTRTLPALLVFDERCPSTLYASETRQFVKTQMTTKSVSPQARSVEARDTFSHSISAQR